MLTVNVDRLYLLLYEVREQIDGVPGLGDLHDKVDQTIRDLTPEVDLNVLTVTPCGDPMCCLGPFCTSEQP